MNFMTLKAVGDNENDPDYVITENEGRAEVANGVNILDKLEERGIEPKIAEAMKRLAIANCSVWLNLDEGKLIAVLPDGSFPFYFPASPIPTPCI